MVFLIAWLGPGHGPWGSSLLCAAGAASEQDELQRKSTKHFARKDRQLAFPALAVSSNCCGVGHLCWRCFAGKSVGQTTRSKLGHPEAAVSEWRLLNVAVR